MTDQRYFTLLTDKGKYKIAKAAADKGEVKFSHFAIGDGNGQETNPLPSATALVHEVWRGQLDSVTIDSKNPAAVIINAIIPHNVGGWWMREFGLFDIDGDMLAVVKPSPNYKATSAEGQLEDVFYEFQLVIGEQAQVVVLVDPSILWATREYVETRQIPAQQLANTPWLPVKALDVVTPPATNSQGDTYVVPTPAKGEWKDKSGQLAEWNGKTWTYFQTPDGHGIGLPDGQILQKVNGSYVPQLSRDVQSGRWNFGVDIGKPNALKIVLSPAPTALSDGMLMIVVPAADTTIDKPTLTVNDFKPKPILNPNGTPLSNKALTKNLRMLLGFDAALDAFVIFSAEKQPGTTISFAARGAGEMKLANGVSYPVAVGTSEITDNTGNCYDPATGVFRPPCDGLYVVTGSVAFSGVPFSASSLVVIEKNGRAFSESSVFGYGRVLNTAVLIRLNASDVVRLLVKIEGMSATLQANSIATTFSAALLGK